MKKTTIALAGLVIFGVAPVATAQVVTYFEIPGSASASDMSPDGRWIVGNMGGDGYLYDRWTNTVTMMPAESLDAAAVSDDGTVVLCNMENPDGMNGDVAGIWTAGSGLNSIGFLPDAGNCPSKSSAYELSADGSVAVGLSWDGCSGRAFRWTAGDGMVEMANATMAATGGCRASAVSADGSLLAGFCQGSFSRTPVIWDAGGAGTVLDPPDGDVVGEVYGMSDDGSKLLGVWNGQGFVFDDMGGQEFFTGTVAVWSANPTDIADNGTIIGFDSQFQTRVAWIRPEGALPVVRMTDYLTSLGATAPASLSINSRISSSGRIIAGHNFFGSGWVVNTCTPDLDEDGIIGFGDLLRVLSDWGMPSSTSPADLDGNGDIGFGDLLAILSSWGPCPASAGE